MKLLFPDLFSPPRQDGCCIHTLFSRREGDRQFVTPWYTLSTHSPFHEHTHTHTHTQSHTHKRTHARGLRSAHPYTAPSSHQSIAQQVRLSAPLAQHSSPTHPLGCLQNANGSPHCEQCAVRHALSDSKSPPPLRHPSADQNTTLLVRGPQKCRRGVQKMHRQRTCTARQALSGARYPPFAPSQGHF